ncbi:hypothetical protein M153_153150002, partial [Pseudoloma neurophilia]
SVLQMPSFMIIFKRYFLQRTQNVNSYCFSIKLEMFELSVLTVC